MVAISILFILLGVIMFVYGYRTKSLMVLFFSGLLALLPIFYLIDWMFFLPMVPPIALLIAYLLTENLKKGNQH